MANQPRFDYPHLVPHACSQVFPNNKERGKIKATQMKQHTRPVRKFSKNETKERRKESLQHLSTRSIKASSNTVTHPGSVLSSDLKEIFKCVSKVIDRSTLIFPHFSQRLLQSTCTTISTNQIQTKTKSHVFSCIPPASQVNNFEIPLIACDICSWSNQTFCSLWFQFTTLDQKYLSRLC